MKHLIATGLLILGAQVLKAQDVISLKSGETINGKVAEVGINEIKYYKASNMQGPVYVVSKADVAQITYPNKSVDVINTSVTSGQTVTASSTQPVVVTAPPQQTVIVYPRPVYHRTYWPVVVDAHIPLFGHHNSYRINHYGGGHH